LIAGDVGTGKTRSVVEVIRSMMADDGRRGLGAPIYVLANQGTSFAETLGAAVGFRFDEHISFRFFVSLVARINSMPRRDADNRLTRVMSAIEKSAFSYMQMYGRPAVIVIDSVDLLQKQAPKTLEYLMVSRRWWVPYYLLYIPAPSSGATIFASVSTIIMGYKLRFGRIDGRRWYAGSRKDSEPICSRLIPAFFTNPSKCRLSSFPSTDSANSYRYASSENIGFSF